MEQLAEWNSPDTLRSIGSTAAVPTPVRYTEPAAVGFLFVRPSGRAYVRASAGAEMHECTYARAEQK